MDTLELDRLSERAASEAAASEAANTSRDAANEREELWKNSERRDRERRRENRAAWYEFEMLLADNHRQLCEEHEERARAPRSRRRGAGRGKPSRSNRYHTTYNRESGMLAQPTHSGSIGPPKAVQALRRSTTP